MIPTPSEDTTMVEVNRLVEASGVSPEELAAKVGVSPAYLRLCLKGKRALAASWLVLLCREVKLDFPQVAATLDRMIDSKTYLRISRAARPYDCSYCGGAIRRGAQYIRLEPFGPTRQGGAPIHHFCGLVL